MDSKVEISVIIPIVGRYNDPQEIYYAYKKNLELINLKYEFVYVLDGDFPDVLEQLKSLQDQGERIKIIKLAKQFGQATALNAGIENSSGETILTLPAYYQVESSEIPKLLNELQNYDMAIGRRWPRTDSRLNRFRAHLLSRMTNFAIGSSFQDLGCDVRAFKRYVVAEVPIYGDQYRFFPVLVSHRGFRIKEVDVNQSAKDLLRRAYRLSTYPSHILSILTVFFLVKFTKKPLRFFGLIGATTFAFGGIFLLYLIIERLFFGVGLADRPALLLSSLLVVLGVQIFALGLIGELIIFTHAKELKEYAVAEIIN